MDQTDIKHPDSISLFEKSISEILQISDDRKRTENGHLEIKIITNIAAFEALEEPWKELASKSNTHIFQTYEWNRIWWKHFGKNKKLHIVTISTGNKLVGIAPLFEDDITFFGRKLYSCLRFLGSYVSQPEGEPLTGRIPYSDYLDFIIHPGYEQIFVQWILDHFNEEKSEIDEFILDEVPDESAIRNTMIPLLARGAYGLSYKLNQASSSPVILLDSTWEAYLNSMNAKERYNTRRYYNRSKPGNTKGFNIERIKRVEELPGVLTDLMNMHQKQWNNRGFPGTFSEKRMRDFIMDIATSFYKNRWMHFNMAIPEGNHGNYVAIDMLITYNKRVSLMHRCMDEDSLFRKQGPGNVLLYTQLNESFNDGYEVFDMLRGSEKFKLRMSTKIKQNKNIVLFDRSNKKGIIPLIANKYIKATSRIRTEKSQLIHVFNGESTIKGIDDYIRFLYKRFKQKII